LRQIAISKRLLRKAKAFGASKRRSRKKAVSKPLGRAACPGESAFAGLSVLSSKGLAPFPHSARKCLKIKAKNFSAEFVDFLRKKKSAPVSNDL
jgi:hypothetical protein